MNTWVALMITLTQNVLSCDYVTIEILYTDEMTKIQYSIQ